jgi:hypothetical protein
MARNCGSGLQGLKLYQYKAEIQEGTGFARELKVDIVFGSLLSSN